MAALAVAFTVLLQAPAAGVVEPGTEVVGPETADATVSATTTADAVAAAPLSFAPPALTSPITVTASASKQLLKLALDKDYVVRMPAQPLVNPRGLIIYGGRNVVLVGGEVHVPIEGLTADNHGGRGLYLKGQTGTIHIEGLRITGPGLKEGINLDQRSGAVVQLQNIRVDTVQGSYSGAHADVLQTWAGPRRLLVDGLTGHTQYQGMFMLPNQHHTGPQPEVFDLRRVSLHGGPNSAYLLWRDSAAWPLSLTDVWVSPGNTASRGTFLWPKGTGAGTAAWPSVRVGAPPVGEFVPAGLAGTSYVSPGYLSAAAAGAGVAGLGAGTQPAPSTPPGTSTPTSTSSTPVKTPVPAVPAAAPAADLPMVVRRGWWYGRGGYASGAADTTWDFGQTGDVPVAGDWDGDGDRTPGVFRPSTGTWYLRDLGGSSGRTLKFASPGDVPVSGDWDGDGRDDIGVFRPATGTWYLTTTNDPRTVTAVVFASPRDVPVTGDWDGDGHDDLGVYRGGTWFQRATAGGAPVRSFAFGNPGDVPVSGDWDHDGRDTAGVFRAGTWFLTNAVGAGGPAASFGFGNPGDTPIIWG